MNLKKEMGKMKTNYFLLLTLAVVIASFAISCKEGGSRSGARSFEDAARNENRDKKLVERLRENVSKDFGVFLFSESQKEIGKEFTKAEMKKAWELNSGGKVFIKDIGDKDFAIIVSIDREMKPEWMGVYKCSRDENDILSLQEDDVIKVPSRVVGVPSDFQHYYVITPQYIETSETYLFSIKTDDIFEERIGFFPLFRKF